MSAATARVRMGSSSSGVAALAAFVVLGLGVLYAGEGGPGGPDTWVQGGVDGVGTPWRQVALGVDFLGEPVGAAALVAALVAACLLRRRPRAAVLVVVGPGAAVLVTKLLKPLVGRTIHDGHLSFPSGHTAFLTALAVVVALLAAAGPVVVLGAALVAGAAMGWAQVALGAHYPTDTVGGWCTALAVVPVAAWLVGRVVGQEAGRGGPPGSPAGGDRPAGEPADRRT
ncbi:phosphatase PAP2 family protein [Streptomyces sp. t39]|uniref:phosphatase PAP2 family protein n=1 Tax=Streptomyces sp. t39 TaxID=1828156 RepID=UPI0011CD9B97|nr:phosphatase PAP2 family protein [Streptomyces sp. t39]TXS52073.1 phosphatase PAP2 family protein [Streptomyces sp. t39]